MMASLFSAPDFPTPPELDDEEIAKRKREALALRGTSNKDTQLSGAAGVTAPIIGHAAALLGGIA